MTTPQILGADITLVAISFLVITWQGDRASHSSCQNATTHTTLSSPHSTHPHHTIHILTTQYTSSPHSTHPHHTIHILTTKYTSSLYNTHILNTQYPHPQHTVPTSSTQYTSSQQYTHPHQNKAHKQCIVIPQYNRQLLVYQSTWFGMVEGTGLHSN